MCFKNVLKELVIFKFDYFYDNAISTEEVNKIVKLRRLWDTQKNIEAEEKWALKREELEKKIRKNNLPFNF